MEELGSVDDAEIDDDELLVLIGSTTLELLPVPAADVLAGQNPLSHAVY